MYTNIVVGFDESASSKAALKEASLRIRKQGGKLTLVHAVYFDQEEFATLPSQMEKRLEIGAHVCRQAKTTVQTDYGLDGNVESIVCEGEPPAVIDGIARGKQADLIALGTYGRKGLKRLLMGSVTAEIILDAPCDVLVVKRPCSACTGNYGSLLLPYDGSEFSRKALVRAAELSKIDGSQITVLYVVPRYEEMMEFFRTESIRKSMFAEAEKVVDGARNVAAKHGVTLRTEIREGHAPDEIIRAAEKLESDLIVMGTYGWKGMDKAIMGSTTNRVITLASSPILVVR